MSGQTIAASLQSPTLFTIANDLFADAGECERRRSRHREHFRSGRRKVHGGCLSERRFQGRISEIRLNPQTVQNVVTYSVIIGIDNPEMKLKPGMTANIAITVDQRDNVLKVAECGAAIHAAGIQSGAIRNRSDCRLLGSGTRRTPRRNAESRGAAAPHLAPGQKWDPSQKIRFSPPKQAAQRPGVVFVLDAQPEAAAKKGRFGHYGRFGNRSDIGRDQTGRLRDHRR